MNGRTDAKASGCSPTSSVVSLSSCTFAVHHAEMEKVKVRPRRSLDSDKVGRRAKAIMEDSQYDGNKTRSCR